MGCNDSHVDETLQEGDAHALGDCIVFVDGLGAVPTPPTSLPPVEFSRVALRIEPCGFRPRVSARWIAEWVEIDNRTRAANVHVYRSTLADTAWNVAVDTATTFGDRTSTPLGVGTFLFRCDCEPSYSATVMVLGHPWFDVTRPEAGERLAAGEFEVRDVPAGERDVVCWHDAVERTPIRASGRIVAYDAGLPVRLVRRVSVVVGETARVDFDVPARGTESAPR